MSVCASFHHGVRNLKSKQSVCGRDYHRPDTAASEPHQSMNLDFPHHLVGVSHFRVILEVHRVGLWRALEDLRGEVVNGAKPGRGFRGG